MRDDLVARILQRISTIKEEEEEEKEVCLHLSRQAEIGENRDTSTSLTLAEMLDEYVGRFGKAGFQFRIIPGARLQELQAPVSADGPNADQQRAQSVGQ